MPTSRRARPRRRRGRRASTPESQSPMRLALRRFRRNWVAMVALIVLADHRVLLLVPEHPGALRRDRATADHRDDPCINSPPSAEAWFGTDDLNRDLYSRIFYGGRVSILIGISASPSSRARSARWSAPSPAIAGGKLDDILMRITDVFLAFPILVLAARHAQRVRRDPGRQHDHGRQDSVRFIVHLAVGVRRGWRWRGSCGARCCRLKQREFVEASRGARRQRIRGSCSATSSPTRSARSWSPSACRWSAAILAESTLSFFGYGPSPGEGQTTWGLLIAEAPETILSGYWWMVVFPCAVAGRHDRVHQLRRRRLARRLRSEGQGR